MKLKTYIGYYDSEKRQESFTHQVALMAYIITDGPVLALRDLADLVKGDGRGVKDIAQLRASLCAAASICIDKGWISRQKRGVYRLSALGRKVWEPMLHRNLVDLA